MTIAGKNIIDLFLDWTMIPLIVLSIITLAFLMERFFYFRSRKFNNWLFWYKFKPYIESGDIQAAQEYIHKINKDAMLIKVMKVGLKEYAKGSSFEYIYRLMESKLLEERQRYKQYLGILSMAAAVGPLLGLFGTVVGLIRAFSNIYKTGIGGPRVVGAGIAIALLTTAYGLIIAVLAVVFFNWLWKNLSDNTNQIRGIIYDFLNILKMKKGG
ncbi:MAG: hypothetical protein DRG20_03955 [Deltaproteobacteria bacterium]|nr:MAG: hypothetical protein DRG20_03955 [Deltaproteobacteria bacterium]